MRKYKVSIDFVAFGELDDEVTKKLEVFNENVKSGDGSHLAIIPPGPSLLSDQLVMTPILNGDGSAGAGGEGGGQDSSSFEFGIDPSIDPELALALRMSMEEEKARLDKANKEKAEAEAKEKLPDIAEEGSAKPSEEGSGSKDKKDDDADKMDTA